MPGIESTSVSRDPGVLAESLFALDRHGWTQFQWDATARIRYCYAYCFPEARVNIPGLVFSGAMHSPGCAYAAEQWVGRVIDVLREVNRG